MKKIESNRTLGNPEKRARDEHTSSSVRGDSQNYAYGQRGSSQSCHEMGGRANNTSSQRAGFRDQGRSFPSRSGHEVWGRLSHPSGQPSSTRYDGAHPRNTAYSTPADIIHCCNFSMEDPNRILETILKASKSGELEFDASCRFLFNVAKARKRLSVESVDTFWRSMGSSLASSRFTAKNIAFFCYGLLGLPHCEATDRVVLQLAGKINQAHAALQGQDVGMVCFGLQRLNSGYAREQLILALVGKIEQSAAQLDGQGIGNACYGLQSLSPSDNTHRLVLALARKIEQSAAQLNGQEIGNACYGLQSLSPSNSTHRLVSALAQKIEQSAAQLNGQEIGNACYGLQSLSPSVSTDCLVSALARKIEQSAAQLDAQGIGNACYGLQSLSPSVSTDCLVSALAQKIEQSASQLNGQSIGNACYGLQSLSPSASTHRLVSALAQKIEQSASQLNGQEIGNACYGLKSLQSGSVMDKLLVVLCEKIIRSYDTGGDLGLFILAQSIYGLHQHTHLDCVNFLLRRLKDRIQAWDQVLSNVDIEPLQTIIAVYRWLCMSGMKENELSPALVHAYEKALSQLPRGHFMEHAICSELNHPNFITWKANQYIHGIEMDLYHPATKTNIELDGIHHLQQKQLIKDEERDAYLSEKLGISILRIPALGREINAIMKEIYNRILC